MTFRKRAFIIFMSFIFFISHDCFAEDSTSADSNFFSGLSLGYESITTSANEYNGLKYGFIAGKDWGLGRTTRLKAFIGLNVGTMISASKASDKVQVTSPVFGLGLGYLKFTALSEVLFHYTSNTHGSAQSLGLQAELLYSLISHPSFKLQFGANLGNTIFMTKSALSYGPALRALWSLGE